MSKLCEGKNKQMNVENEQTVPPQYAPLLDSAVLQMADAVETLMPVFNELGSKQLVVNVGDITIIMQGKE